MSFTLSDAKPLLEAHGQSHVLRFWDRLSSPERETLLGQIESIQFPLVERLVHEWVTNTPTAEPFASIEPPRVIPPVEPERADCREALAAGEDALRSGRIGLVMVAGGQGTRLGYDGPKGAYPIGPVTGRSLFHYHGDKLAAIQRRYGKAIPWYIMVSETNETATRAFFAEHRHFGLDPANIVFFRQRMMPCVDGEGRLMLDTPGSLAMNPNGHGGAIPAIVENGIAAHARERGVDTLTYIQVDNWAVKPADPYFIGYHVLRGSEFSSKVHRKVEPRESVGVHCVCDGVYRIIEYSELDIYPQLLAQNPDGSVVYFAGNPAIHVIDLGFIERVYAAFDRFPWHVAHKKVPYIDETGNRVEPAKPNGYKFETFVFDAMQFMEREPVELEIYALGEYTPTKSFDGPNSVTTARASMARYWAPWLEAAGRPVERGADGTPLHPIEISPAFAYSQDEFVERAMELRLPNSGPVGIGPDGVVA